MVGKSVICIPIKQKKKGILKRGMNQDNAASFMIRLKCFDYTFNKKNFTY